MRKSEGPDDLNRLTGLIVDAGIEVHRRLGPGLLEKSYRVFLAKALMDRGLSVAQEVPVEVSFDGVTVDQALRLDIQVEGRVIVEVKAVSRLQPIHVAQVLTYLRLTGCPIGILLNFNTFPLSIRRLVHEL